MQENLVNKKLVLAARPEGLIKSSDFEMKSEAIPELEEGQFLVKTHYLSLAPVMKFYMIDGAGIEKPLQFGETMRGRGAGQVIASKNKAFTKGDYVHGKFGWQQYVISDGSPSQMMYKIKQDKLPISTALGVLGMTGFTSYFGLLDVGELKPTDTVLVSAAAGGVGSIVGQIAKIKGAKTIGLTSSDVKCKMLIDKLGYDYAINYKTQDIADKISEYSSDGIDIYFDNVGGQMLDAALSKIKRYARVVCCGRISTYDANLKVQDYKMSNWHMIGANRAKMEGFFIYDFENQFPKAEKEMTQWILEGKLTYQEDVLEGLEKMPEALNRLFEGKNVGKQLVKIN